MNQDELSNGRLIYNVQCKTTTTSLPYGKLLAEMPEGRELNVIFHKQTRLVGTRFVPIGEYGILPLKDLLDLIKHATLTGYEPNPDR